MRHKFLSPQLDPTRKGKKEEIKVSLLFYQYNDTVLILFELFYFSPEKKPVVVVDENEISELINVSKLKEDLQRSLDNLKADYVKNLTIRSGAGWFSITTSFDLFKNLEISLLQVQLKVCQLNLRGKPMLCKKLHRLEGKDLSYLWLIFQVFHKPSRML